MTSDKEWNDEKREQLRATLRWFILGELRLAKRDHGAILDICHETYIDEDAPEEEWDELYQFAADELKRVVDRLTAEQATWPDETDCDRLDRVEAALRERGIILWQASPCCDTCTGGLLPERADEIEARYPGFRDRLRGYAFFIEQNLPEMLSDDTKIEVYLAYGWVPPDDSKAAPDVYKKHALDIGHEVRECLRAEGLKVDWHGDFSKKIGVAVNWQRRARLE